MLEDVAEQGFLADVVAPAGNVQRNEMGEAVLLLQQIVKGTVLVLQFFVHQAYVQVTEIVQSGYHICHISTGSYILQEKISAFGEILDPLQYV